MSDNNTDNRNFCFRFMVIPILEIIKLLLVYQEITGF